MLIALAVMAAQWAGLVHSIEHRHHLGPGHVQNDLHLQLEHPTNELLHSCLLFDGVTTAQVAISNAPVDWALPTLPSLRTDAIELTAPRNTLFAQRIRVRDPPLFS